MDIAEVPSPIILTVALVPKVVSNVFAKCTIFAIPALRPAKLTTGVFVFALATMVPIMTLACRRISWSYMAFSLSGALVCAWLKQKTISVR